MSYKRKIAAFTAVLTAIAALSGCSLFGEEKSAVSQYDFSGMKLVQLEEPYEGQPVAVITTSLGVVKVALYPEYAPKTVENFTARVKEGYYDGKKVFSVKDNAIFASGALEEDGYGGLNEGQEPVENEFSVNLWPYKGALLAFNSKPGYSDNRFFMVNGVDFGDAEIETLRELEKDGQQMLPNELLISLKEKGCLFMLSGFYTVFGQAYEGLDIVEQICLSEYDPGTTIPLKDIIIEKIELIQYSKEKEQ